LRWRPTIPACLPTRLRLAPSICLPACLPTRLRLAPSICLPANLPARLQLAPSTNLPVPPSNLTSDSHRPLIPSALPSSQPAACATDQPSGPAWRTKRPTPAVASPALLPGPVSDLRLQLAFPPGLRTQPPIPRLLHPFGAALEPTCSLRYRSTFRPSLTDPTSDSSASHLQRRLQPILRLASPINLQLPSGQFPTCVGYQPSG